MNYTMKIHCAKTTTNTPHSPKHVAAKNYKQQQCFFSIIAFCNPPDDNSSLIKGIPLNGTTDQIFTMQEYRVCLYGIDAYQTEPDITTSSIYWKSPHIVQNIG